MNNDSPRIMVCGSGVENEAIIAQLSMNQNEIPLIVVTGKKNNGEVGCVFDIETDNLNDTLLRPKELPTEMIIQYEPQYDEPFFFPEEETFDRLFGFKYKPNIKNNNKVNRVYKPRNF